MSDETNYRPKEVPEIQRRFPPRHKSPPIPEGEDFDTLTAKHGKPKGRFDLDAPPKRTK